MRVIAHLFARLHRDQRGSVLLFVIGFLPVAIGAAAFVIDVANGAERYESFAQTLKYLEDRRLLDKMPEAWHTVLTGFVLPLRHYEQGAQLLLTNANRFAYGTTLTQAMGFAGFDRIGNAQQLSLIGLALAGGAALAGRVVELQARFNF